MQIPQQLIDSLQGLKGFDEKSFRASHETEEKITAIRLNPSKIKAATELFTELPPTYNEVPWCSTGLYLHERPSFTFDPLFHAGCYYVQEASSMFLEVALKQTVDLSQPLRILDLCAAPGGKSTHIQSLISPDSLLVSNEVIRARTNILKDNMMKWGSSNVLVTNNDARDFAKTAGFFDIIIIDAPCSGSGLFRRDAAAINEWSENNVALCNQRQQRILADVFPALKDGGLVIYSTCSYSKEEDEQVVAWITDTFETNTCPLDIKKEWNITEVKTQGDAYCYRFWPYLVQGEGFFMAVFRKASGIQKGVHLRPKTKALSKADKQVIDSWMNLEDSELVSFGQSIYAWPQNLFADFDFLAQQLNVIYSGTLAGNLLGRKFIPEHGLAMSKLVSTSVARVELDYQSAIRYLQRKDISTSSIQTGWKLATYKNHPLGWMNVLHNRINNNYPKSLRILKEMP